MLRLLLCRCCPVGFDCLACSARNHAFSCDVLNQTTTLAAHDPPVIVCILVTTRMLAVLTRTLPSCARRARPRTPAPRRVKLLCPCVMVKARVKRLRLCQTDSRVDPAWVTRAPSTTTASVAPARSKQLQTVQNAVLVTWVLASRQLLASVVCALLLTR